LRIEYVANPPPTYGLSFNGCEWHELSDERRSRLNVVIGASVVSVMLYNLVTADTGVYTLLLENELGTDQIVIEVVVAGKISVKFHQING